MITVSLSGGGVGTGNVIAYLNANGAAPVAAQEVVDGGLSSDHASVLGIAGGGCPGTVQGGGLQGDMANFQTYNTSLSSSEVEALYLAVIGGAPIQTQNLVEWWPLNGNANDYSGNDNNGQASNVIYTGSWETGYSTP